jgi:hypothetical protein
MHLFLVLQGAAAAAAATALPGNLTNCSACTFEMQCKAADDPGDCHWCAMPAGHGGKSYCAANGTICRRGETAEPPVAWAPRAEAAVDAMLAAFWDPARRYLTQTVRTNASSPAGDPEDLPELLTYWQYQEAVHAVALAAHAQPEKYGAWVGKMVGAQAEVGSRRRRAALSCSSSTLRLPPIIWILCAAHSGVTCNASTPI